MNVGQFARLERVVVVTSDRRDFAFDVGCRVDEAEEKKRVRVVGRLLQSGCLLNAHRSVGDRGDTQKKKALRPLPAAANSNLVRIALGGRLDFMLAAADRRALSSPTSRRRRPTAR